MALLTNSMPVCPEDRHCAEWARKYLEYCLCSARDGFSLSLGLISVISWGVAEVPQILTNYKEKSAEGLSLAFLCTWIVGDFFNVFGCILEPETLPTQYFMALLYTVTTFALTAQSVYYGHIYHRMKHRKKCHKAKVDDESSQKNCDVDVNGVNNTGILIKVSGSFDKENSLSSPIPLPALNENYSPYGSPGRTLYYMSARSLTSSHTPLAGSFLGQGTSSFSSHFQTSLEEPLLNASSHTQSAPPARTRSLLCVVFALVFLGNFHLQQSTNKTYNLVSENQHKDTVFQVGRRLLQLGLHTSGLSQTNSIEGSGIGTYLGWGMAAIYMGGRFPQICLNIRRGHVEGLNPLMFFFALIGNVTYVGSILVNSVEWSKIRPNLPWLVDAGGCVLLDIFILIQFIYFSHWKNPDSKHKPEISYSA